MATEMVRYDHHGTSVAVREDLRGKHRDYCLCYQGCAHFKPGQSDNCAIAERVYHGCVTFGIVTPVWECPKYTAEAK